MSALSRVVFARPSQSQGRDDGFELEADALDALGIEPLWLSLDSIAEERLEAALGDLEGDGSEVILRSWMLSRSDYEYLYDTLAERGLVLINSPHEYASAHQLPNYFDAIAGLTSPTRWTVGFDLDEAWEAASELDGPRMIKDYVKSAKEDWDAFYIKPEVKRVEFERVCRRFMDARGEHLEGGLVFRSLEQLTPLALDRVGNPVFDEYRLFYRNSKLIAAAPYYEVDGGANDFSIFDDIAASIESAFFTIDVASLVGGGWTVIEVGDGGVSSLPQLLDPRAFYQALLIDSSI